VKERPILFSGPMVRALLDGSKTQTRRIVKGMALDWLQPGMFTPEYVASSSNLLSPFGFAGDRLWVRETWAIECLGRIGTPGGYDCSYELRYRADGAAREFDCPPGTDDSAYLRAYDRMRGDWWPSIHMPRWASRITLEVAHVSVERLQDISYEDALAEGVSDFAATFADEEKNAIGETPEQTARRLEWPQRQYRSLWDGLNAARGYGWNANPWVWVVDFKRA
jgi:hypothetical protein